MHIMYIIYLTGINHDPSLTGFVCVQNVYLVYIYVLLFNYFT